MLTKQHSQEVLVLCFNWEKSAAEAHRMLVEVYGDNAPTDKLCRGCFQRFKSSDFDVEDRDGGEKKKISKIPNWRHYLLETRAKCKKNWQNHWK